MRTSPIKNITGGSKDIGESPYNSIARHGRSPARILEPAFGSNTG
jgi:hypothetical protein